GFVWRVNADDGMGPPLLLLGSEAGPLVTSGVVVDRAGNAVLAGTLYVTGGNSVAVVIKTFPPVGLDYYLMDGSGDDAAVGIALGNTEAVYVVGHTSSEDFPVTEGALQPY